MDCGVESTGRKRFTKACQAKGYQVDKNLVPQSDLCIPGPEVTNRPVKRPLRDSKEVTLKKLEGVFSFFSTRKSG